MMLALIYLFPLFLKIMTGEPLVQKYRRSERCIPSSTPEAPSEVASTSEAPSTSNNASPPIPKISSPVWVKPFLRESASVIDKEILESKNIRFWAHQKEGGHLERYIKYMLRWDTYHYVCYNDCNLIFGRNKFGHPWVPYVPDSRELPAPYRWGRRCFSIRSPERGGLTNLIKRSSRIKEIEIKHAIRYSYCRDHRFVLLLCCMLGFAIWWALVPEILLFNSTSICISPNLDLLCQVARDTYIHNICSSHPQVLSPCDCGEPLNKEVKEIIKEPPFDPLGSISRTKGASVFLASILLSLALAE